VEDFNATLLLDTNALQTLLIHCWKNQGALLLTTILVILIKANFAIIMDLMIGVIYKPPILAGATLIQLIDLFVKMCLRGIILLIMEINLLVKIRLKM
jgi:hypothetical protein